MTRGRKSSGKSAAEARVEAAIGLLAAPETLSPGARNVFDRVVSSRPAGFYGAGDTELLVAYAWASELHAIATAQVQVDGMLLTNEKTARKYENPAIRVMQTTAASIAQLSVKLRLSASSRVHKDTSARAAKQSAGDASTKRPWH